MSKNKHLHLYKKINIGRDGNIFIVFKCMKPDCTHYTEFTLAEGKICECNRCHNSMILTKISMTLTKPHCASCVKRKNPIINQLAELLDKI